LLILTLIVKLELNSDFVLEAPWKVSMDVVDKELVVTIGAPLLILCIDFKSFIIHTNG